MKKQVYLSIAGLIALMTVSCAFEDITPHEVKSNAVTQESGSFDSGRYLDVSSGIAESTNDQTLSNYITCGKFVCGTSSLVFHDGIVTCYTSSMSVKGYEGKPCRMEYEYQIKPASSTTSYLCPKNTEAVTLFIDGRYIPHEDIKDYMTVIPLYGFGENRVEVSPVTKGFSVMPSGAYWK